MRATVPIDCIVCGSKKIDLDGPTYFCRSCKVGTLPHGDPVLQAYWTSKIIADARHMRSVIVLTLLFICAAPTEAQLQPGDTLRYSMRFLSQSDSGFVTFRDTTVRVPAAKVVFIGQLFRVGFLPSAKTNDTVVVLGGNFPAAFQFNLAVGDTGVFWRNGYAAGIRDSSTALDDSVSAVLALLRWGIKTISYTDSSFWKMHEEEISLLKLLTGQVAGTRRVYSVPLASFPWKPTKPSVFLTQSYNGSTQIMTITVLERP